MAIAPVEYVATLLSSRSTVDLSSALGLIPLTVTLVALAAPVLALGLGALTCSLRVLVALRSPGLARTWPGLLASADAVPGKPAVALAWIWAAVPAVTVYVASSYWLTMLLTRRFHAPEVVALLLSLLQVVLFGLAAMLTLLLQRPLGAIGRRLQPRLGRANPLGSMLVGVPLVVAVSATGLWLLVKAWPQLDPLVPWRHFLVLCVFALGAWGAPGLVRLAGKTCNRLCGGWTETPGRRRLVARVALGALGVVIVVTMLRIGAHPGTKYVAVTSSPPMSTLIAGLRWLNDFDRDGYGSLLGENDCAPFDSKIHPGARDIPDNGVDENCNGRDFSFKKVAKYRQTERIPLPAAFRQPWNILLITVDAVRYDHTGFGGYRKQSGRDLTPNLDDLARRSTSFSFCNAPSAGTLASVPAMLTSRFFHSGIALNEGRRKGNKRRIDESNVLMAEVMKRGGYYSGAIVNHRYFSEGHDQGFDYFDNELETVTRDAHAVTSPETTKRAVAWIAANMRRKWFLWLHYLDPHSEYVAHPEHKVFGNKRVDLYDSEIAFTDMYLGRLLAELKRMEGYDRTAIIITADHGDGFREHGFINHGMALYREMIHVPLVVHVPNLPPRVVGGAVSPLDVLPTMVDLAGIDAHDLSFEGESLVPQLFFGRDAHHRVVFSETNYMRTLRAAITSRYKLIGNLKSQTYELYDLTRDPWEKRNVWSRDKAGGALMRGYLDEWLERVYYSRDIKMNQAELLRSEYLLTHRPKPTHVSRARYEKGALRVLGFDVDKKTYRPGDKVKAQVYLEVVRRPAGSYNLQLSGWGPPEAERAKKTPGLRHRTAWGPQIAAGGGLYPTSRWRPGEYLRHELTLRIPRKWRSSEMDLGLRLFPSRGGPAIEPEGASIETSANTALLGVVPVGAALSR